MFDSARNIARSELYDLVWLRPISQIAPELGISGPGLAKLCERNGIPVPERGYWAKLQNGKRLSLDAAQPCLVQRRSFQVARNYLT